MIFIRDSQIVNWMVLDGTGVIVSIMRWDGEDIGADVDKYGGEAC